MQLHTLHYVFRCCPKRWDNTQVSIAKQAGTVSTYPRVCSSNTTRNKKVVLLTALMSHFSPDRAHLPSPAQLNDSACHFRTYFDCACLITHGVTLRLLHLPDAQITYHRALAAVFLPVARLCSGHPDSTKQTAINSRPIYKKHAFAQCGLAPQLCMQS